MNMHEIVLPEELHEHFSPARIKAIHADLQLEVEELTTDHGAGVFIKEDVPLKDGPGYMATVCKWKTVKTKRKLTFVRYHLYRGDLPDPLLDDINLIAETTDNPVWKK